MPSTGLRPIQPFQQLSAAIRTPLRQGLLRGRESGVVADDFSVVRGEQSRLRGREAVPHVVTDQDAGAAPGEGVTVRRQRETIIGQDVAGGINPNDPIIELVADQGVAIGQPDGASGLGCGDAHCPGTVRRSRVRGEILPDDLVGGVDLHDAGVAGVGEEGVAVGEAAGEGEGVHRATGGKSVDDLIGAGDFEGAAVALIRNQDVAVGEQFGGIGRVELVGRIGVGAGILPDDFPVIVDFNDAVVALVGDQHVETGDEGALHRGVQ